MVICYRKTIVRMFENISLADQFWRQKSIKCSFTFFLDEILKKTKFKIQIQFKFRNTILIREWKSLKRVGFTTTKRSRKTQPQNAVAKRSLKMETKTKSSPDNVVTIAELRVNVIKLFCP